jgi:AcrR family transcriptional regulator
MYVKLGRDVVVIGRQAERSESTKARMLVVARDLFVRRGYAAVPAEDLVREAGLTRGALYHHFGGKEGLFAALYEQVQREVTDRIDAAADGAADAWSALRIGCHTFLESCLDPVVQQVVLLDAPVVLGWEAWREVDARYGLGSLKEGLHHARESGAIAGQPLDAVAHLLLGAMNEAALWIARAKDPDAALVEAKAGLDRLLGGLRDDGPSGSTASRGD